MNKDISFDKDLNFNTRVASIETISLEDDLEVNSDAIEGNLYVSGKYKILDASTILEDFSFSVPCSINIIDDLDSDTIKYNITNFTYEIIDNSILRCHISMNISGEKMIRECDDDIVPDELKEIPVKERTIEKEDDDTKNEKEENNDKVKEDDKDSVSESLFSNLEDNGWIL